MKEPFHSQIIKPASFDWDKGNLDKNLTKHNVEVKECEVIFTNRPLKTYKDVRHSQKEDRYVALGTTDNNRLLYLVFTIRKYKIRIISARDMSRKERNLYEKK